jgi:outer membrane murein-binding lipoprotein Lpp
VISRLAAAVVAMVLLTGCVSPALGNGSYRGKGQAAVQAALSEVETASLVVEQMRRDRIPKAYADETVSASEQAMGSIVDSFGSVQPPPASDQVHDEVSGLLDEADSAVSAARIATRRVDRAQLGELQERLHQIAERLRDAEGRLK